ncbi:MAG: hypothetical protein ACI9LN_001336, partial [Saprospiraceae bacterium]
NFPSSLIHSSMVKIIPVFVLTTYYWFFTF